MKTKVKTFVYIATIVLIIICLFIGVKEVIKMAQIIGSNVYNPVASGSYTPAGTGSADPLGKRRKVSYDFTAVPYNTRPHSSGVTPIDRNGPLTTVSTSPEIRTTSSVSGFPEYTIPELNLNVPDYAWNPTDEQRAGWLEQATNRAGLQIDPQRASELEALENFKQNVTKQIGEINPRYTKMSLAIANIVDNTIKQDIVDELIRRGATTSGEMEKQLEGAGRFEVEQRAAVEGERNQLINALNTQEQQRGVQSADRLAELERLRGMTTSEELFQEEKYQRGTSAAEKSALFEAELAKASLEQQAQAAQYEAQYQQALFEAQMQQQEWERAQTERQFSFNQAQANYAQNQPPSAPTPYESLRNQLLEQEARWNDYIYQQAIGGGVAPTTNTSPWTPNVSTYGYGRR